MINNILLKERCRFCNGELILSAEKLDHNSRKYKKGQWRMSIDHTLESKAIHKSMICTMNALSGWNNKNSKLYDPKVKFKKKRSMQRIWRDPNSIYNKKEYRDKLSKSAKILVKKTGLTLMDKKVLSGKWKRNKNEEYVYKLLINIFNEYDVKSPYKDTRYPFWCDFYIKSLDLFIELNVGYQHGNHPFNPESKDDIIIIESFKKKNTRGYLNAIDTIMNKDPLKRLIAKNNNLKYLELWSLPKNENELIKSINNIFDSKISLQLVNGVTEQI